MKKLPFDLEKALAGAPLVTRDGSKARNLIKDESPADFYTHKAEVLNDGEWCVLYYSSNGKGMMNGEEWKFDLFLVDTGNPLVPALAGLLALCWNAEHYGALRLEDNFTIALKALSQATGIPDEELTQARCEKLSEDSQ